MGIELTEALLSKAAGWEAMKLARAYLAQGQVLSSNWSPPLLRGVVQAGEISYRASLVLKGETDIENLCTCREARDWGQICAHAVGVGLHWLKRQHPPAAPTRGAGSTAAQSNSVVRKTPALLRDPKGEPAELFIILPPNLDQAIARGKVMLVFEAKWNGGRGPLNALPKGRSFAFNAQDEVVIGKLEEIGKGETPAVLQLDLAQVAGLLPVLAEHPNITVGKSAEITVTRSPLGIPLKATLEESGEIVVSARGKISAGARVGEWVWQNNTFQPAGLPEILKDIISKAVRITRAQVPQFLNRDWPQLNAGGDLEANFKAEDFVLEPQAPRFFLELKGGLAQLSALLQCSYGPRIMTVGMTAEEESVWLPDPADPRRYSTRDLAAERAALGRLRQSGFSGPDPQGRLQLLGQNSVLTFLAREFPRMQREWSVTLEERFERSLGQNVERIEPRFQITPSGVQWFDLGVAFTSSGGETFSQADIQRLLLSGQSHARLKSGKLAVIDTGAVEELQEVLRDCGPQQHGQGYRISNTQAGFLESTLQEHSNWRVQAPPAWRERAAKQSGALKLECPPLGNLETVLRPYQKEGVAWLHFLRENGFGGILADEMGLGKTLQTLALLRAHKGHSPKPALIVCPTSLVFNWVAESAKFTPELKVLALQGPERHALFQNVSASDLVITSYALIRRDAERYAGLEFDTVVLDEAQHIKNRQTQNAQAVKAVKAEHRFVLTGTPTGELCS